MNEIILAIILGANTGIAIDKNSQWESFNHDYETKQYTLNERTNGKFKYIYSDEERKEARIELKKVEKKFFLFIENF